MKTPEQIKEWLQKQEWYPQFVRNVKNDSLNSEEDVQDYISGKMQEYTFAYSFSWYESPEGFDFWHEKEKQFFEWYDKEETI
ncbi:MAG: hypothetical protein IAB81_02730 [Bacteroidetes bacterium]|uniref:Uncharacterized protein n=1 Tax=Candidatus Merdivivens pullicola TaxID=2840872 RepID=A0A9D9IIQ1_9BACT|nr:hypothetical protein [Candidatus Merdivivens pullicola]